MYNVVDDVPLTRREFTDAFAHAFGCKRLRIVPPAIVRATAGAASHPLLRSQRVRNAAFRAATGWAPGVPSAVEGWAAIAASKEASNV